MKKFKHPPTLIGACLLFLACLEIAALSLAIEQPARAYVDPGSGFVLLQVAGSMMAGAIFYLRRRLRKLFGFARKTEQSLESVVTHGETETPQ